MEYLLSFFAFGVVMFLAVVSPGPDFLVVSKNSIAHSRKIGFYTAVGIALGVFVHVAYTLVGIGVVISQSVIVFSFIKFAGAAYLIYLGVQLMTEKGSAETDVATAEHHVAKTPLQALREGFITNVLNPKATLFFVSVFSQFVTPNLPISIRAVFGLEAAGIACAWFVILACVLTHPATRGVIARVQARLLKAMGAGLVLLGVRVASE